ncbi:hypothetical protein, partial [Pseudomonas sp. PA-6-4F]|uniref:hypothetical protein n=1 Tax=Pseudomonas sp. PA-6-4F TaxID=2665486 RepID=UPI001F231804
GCNDTDRLLPGKIPVGWQAVIAGKAAPTFKWWSVRGIGIGRPPRDTKLFKSRVYSQRTADVFSVTPVDVPGPDQE